MFESEAIVHVDLRSASILGTTDALLNFGTIASRPGVGADAARGQALGHFGLPPGLSERSDLMVLVDNGGGWLTWRVRVSGDDARGPVDKIAFVDAFGGQVRRSWDNLETATAGTGKGFFNGTGDTDTPTARRAASAARSDQGRRPDSHR